MKLTDKPGSVVDSHSSRPAIAHWLKQPTRVQYGPYLMNPYLALLRVGLPCRGLLPAARCALTAPFHPYLIRLRGPSAVCSLLHWSWAVTPQALRHLALWSPDFPPLRPSPLRGRRRSGDCLVSFGAKYRGFARLCHPHNAFRSPASRQYFAKRDKYCRMRRGMPLPASRCWSVR